MAEDQVWVTSARVGLAFVLVAACATDLRSRRIPNLVSAAALLAGLIWHGLAPDGAGVFDPYRPGGLGWRDSAAGAAISLALLLVPYAVGLLGAGDVKLLAALGAWVGIASLPLMWLAVMLSGALLACGWAVANGDVGGMFSRTAALLRALAFRLLGMPGLALLEISGPGKDGDRRLPFALAISAGCATYGLGVYQTYFN